LGGLAAIDPDHFMGDAPFRDAESLRDFKQVGHSGDTTPCRMTGVTFHRHVHYNERSPSARATGLERLPLGPSLISCRHEPDKSLSAPN